MLYLINNVNKYNPKLFALFLPSRSLSGQCLIAGQWPGGGGSKVAMWCVPQAHARYVHVIYLASLFTVKGIYGAQILLRHEL
jgi:hypothetical protein